MQPYWEDRIAAELLRGRNVLVAAHGNSLRAVVKMLEGISDDEIAVAGINTARHDAYRRLLARGYRTWLAGTALGEGDEPEREAA